MTLPANIRVGTSGYSFEDWRGGFYPAEIDKGKMLDFYVQHFSTVEINSTYYRIPHPAVFYHLARKSPQHFDFIVKVPQSLTHRRQDVEKDFASFQQSIEPMVQSGKLSCLLAQFPYSFKYSAESLEYISIMSQAVAPHRLFVEFRHDGWMNRGMYDHLRAQNVGYVCVDEPQLTGLLKPEAFVTTDIGYVRLHGRNAEKWWDGGDRRYDYTYSEEEMIQWRDKVRKLATKTTKVYVYFNNCFRGQAVANAKQFMELLGGR